MARTKLTAKKASPDKKTRDAKNKFDVSKAKANRMRVVAPKAKAKAKANPKVKVAKSPKAEVRKNLVLQDFKAIDPEFQRLMEAIRNFPLVDGNSFSVLAGEITLFKQLKIQEFLLKQTDEVKNELYNRIVGEEM